MKSPAWTLPPIKINLSKAFIRGLALFIPLVGAHTALAQAVISASPSVPNLPPAFPQPPDSDSAPRTVSQNSLFQWGPVTAHPYIDYRFLYGDGIQSSPGKQTSTSIQNIAPGVLLNVGTHWTVDYKANQTYYSDSALKDTLDHSLRLFGGTTYEAWSFQLSQTFVSTFDPLIETGQQTKENSYDTSAVVGYHFSDQFQLTTNFGYQARFATVFSDSRESTIGEELHYLVLPRVDTSVGLDYGYVDEKSGIDMTFTRPLAQLNWRATDKVNFSLKAGVETRKFRVPGSENLNSPLFGTALTYRPFKTTTISFSADRSVSVSYFTNQITRNTGWGLNLQQRLLGHFYLRAGYSGQKTRYISTDPLVSANRSDNNYNFNAKLSTVFFERATVGIVYQNSHNDSNSTGFGFTSSQIGLELGYHF